MQNNDARGGNTVNLQHHSTKLAKPLPKRFYRLRNPDKFKKNGHGTEIGIVALFLILFS